MTYLLQDLHLPLSQPATLYYDNQSALQIPSNQVFHECTKHIKIDCHLVCEKLNSGILKLLPYLCYVCREYLHQSPCFHTVLHSQAQVGHDKYLLPNLSGGVNITYFMFKFLFKLFIFCLKLLGPFSQTSSFYVIATCIRKILFLIYTPLYFTIRHISVYNSFIFSFLS